MKLGEPHRFQILGENEKGEKIAYCEFCNKKVILVKQIAWCGTQPFYFCPNDPELAKWKQNKTTRAINTNRTKSKARLF